MFSKKKIIKFFIFLIITVIVAFLFIEPKSFEYFSTECKIYTKERKLVYTLPNYQLCDFHPDGLVIASAPFTGELKLIDRDDSALWSSKVYVHHDLKFTNDKNGILAIISELTQFQNSTVRSDCVSRRDLNNKVLHQWCLGDHLKELEQLGFSFKKFLVPDDARFSALTAEYEISHANSVYEIGPNSRSKTDPVFSEGNYIVNLFTPSLALIVLDKNMEKIIWHKKMREFYYEHHAYSVSGHDYQITQDGHVLAFFNKMKRRNTRYTNNFTNLFKLNLGIMCCYEPPFSFFSRLVEFDPYTDEIYWLYEDTPSEAFKSDLNGSVSKLEHSYLYTDTTNGGRATEITPDGKKIWTYVPEAIDPKTQKHIMLIGFKPLLDNRFLKSRNLDFD